MHNVHFEILPSRFLYYLTIGISILVLGILLILPLDGLIKIGFAVLIAVYLAYFYYQHRSKKMVVQSFKQDSQGLWQINIKPGQWYKAELLNQNFISDFLVILRFQFLPSISTKCASKKIALILFEHQLSQTHWRSLQMQLRKH